MPPPTGSNLVLWLEADVGTYTDTGGTTPTAADGDLVALWKDQSSNHNDFQQATSANRPAWRTAVVNGKPVVRSVLATHQFLGSVASVSHGIGTGEFHWAVVCKPGVNRQGINPTLCFGSISGSTFALQSAGSGFTPDYFTGFWTGHPLGGSAQVVGTWYLVEIARIGGVIQGWSSSGGAAPAALPTTYTDSFSVPNATLWFNYDQGGDYVDGDVAELLLYKPSLNSTDRATLENYLRTKYWGASGSLLQPPAMDGLGGAYLRDPLGR